MAIVSLFAGTLYTSCKKDRCKGVTCLNGGSCNEGNCSCPTGYSGTRCETELQGKVSFYTTRDAGGGNITVNCGGLTSLITSYYSSGDPGCSASGCANFSLNAGTYSFSASSASGTWSGQVTVQPGRCSTQELLVNATSYYGQVNFWTAYNYGYITVNCAGYSGNITSYYYSGAPTCGSAGCVTMTLPVGTYSYSAYSSSYNWNGYVIVSANGCYKLQLL